MSDLVEQVVLDFSRIRLVLGLRKDGLLEIHAAGASLEEGVEVQAQLGQTQLVAPTLVDQATIRVIGPAAGVFWQAFLLLGQQLKGLSDIPYVQEYPVYKRCPGCGARLRSLHPREQQSVAPSFLVCANCLYIEQVGVGRVEEQ